MEKLNWKDLGFVLGIINSQIWAIGAMLSDNGLQVIVAAIISILWIAFGVICHKP